MTTSKPDPHHEPATVGVLISNLGSPDAPTPSALRRYLRQFLSDQRVVELPRLLWWPILHGIILPFRSRRSAKIYHEIWTAEGSPLVATTAKQAAALQQYFEQQRPDVHVRFAMRYGNPSIEQGLQELKALGATSIIVLPLYPQYSATTTASTFDEVSRVLSTWRWLPELHFVQHYADNPRYIAALASQLQTHIAEHGQPDKIAFSFHGIPKRNFSQGDPYYCYCHKTARLVAEACGLRDEQWQLCFQSRFGRAPWLQPYTDELLAEWANDGKTHVAVMCPGFAADCLETLEEIQIRYRDVFMQAGGKQFHYVPALNDSPAHIDCLAALVESVLPNNVSLQSSQQLRPSISATPQ